MFWLGLFIKYGLPLAVKLGWVNDCEKLLVEGWYAAKQIKVYHPKDIQTPDAQPTNTNMVSGGFHDRGPSNM